MNCSTRSRPSIGCLLTLTLSAGLTACGASDEGSAFSDIALPTFSKDRVAREAPVEVRRLLAGTEGWSFGTMSPSPDGRFLTDIGWGYGGGASVIDVATGEEIYIPNQVPEGFADMGSKFSPDGSRVAFSFWGAEGYEVRSIGVDGSDPQVHLKIPAVPGEPSPGHRDFPGVQDWSKDGRFLLITRYPDGEDAQIATIDLTTNEYHVLNTVDGAGTVGSFFSPDGRFVAYAMRADQASKERDIYIISTDGSSERTLLQTPDHEVLLGWLPDGSGILFHRSADDSRAIWKLPLKDGRVAGDPELIKDDVWKMTGFGFSDADYFYGVVVSRAQVHTASFDLETGRMLEAPKPVVELSHDGTSTGVWSPDSRRLAYLARDAEEIRLVIQSLTGEVLQDFPLSLDPRGGMLGWTPSGIIIRGRDASGRGGLHLLSPETGELHFLTEAHHRGVTVSEDGSKLFIDRGEADASPIIEHDLATGEERVLVEAEFLFGEESPVADWTTRAEWNWTSPNGKFVASGLRLGTDRHFKIINTTTGEVYRTNVPFRLFRPRGMRWSADSRYVLFEATVEARDTERGLRTNLYRFSAEDGSLLKLMEITREMSRAGPVNVSPDGRHIAMNLGENRQEIWRMSFNDGG